MCWLIPPFFSPHYTFLTLQKPSFCSFLRMTAPFAWVANTAGSAAEKEMARRGVSGRGRARVWSDKQFLFSFFPPQISPDVSTLCPLPLQPFPQRTAICSGVLVMKLIFWAILVPLNRQEYRQDGFHPQQLLPLPGKDSMLRGCTTFPLAYSIRKMSRAEY